MLQALLDTVIVDIAELTADITWYRLQPAAGGPLPAFDAGAHVVVDIAPQLSRAYSLCSDPAQTAFYEIAVKREALGRGGSLTLHRQAAIGGHLRIGHPRNLFRLADGAAHHLLIGGGIGCTPLISMAHALHRQGASFSFWHFHRGPLPAPFTRLFQDTPWHERVIHCADQGMPPDLAELASTIAARQADTHLYCCGPAGFMRAVRACCPDLPSSDWHEESFGASTAVPAPEASTAFTLYLARSQREIAVAPGQTMLDALRKHGVAIDTACEQGICGSCVVQYRDGQPVHHDECMSAEERQEYVAVCCAGCSSTALSLEL